MYYSEYMTLTVRLDDAMSARLDRLAKKTGRAKAYYIKRLLEDHIDDLEDFYLAAEAVERINRGESRTYTLEEAKAELGLDD